MQPSTSERSSSPQSARTQEWVDKLGGNSLALARNRGLAARGTKRKHRRIQIIPTSSSGHQVCEAEDAGGINASQLKQTRVHCPGPLPLH